MYYTHALSLIAEEHPRSPALWDSPLLYEIAGQARDEAAGQARDEAKNKGYSSRSAQNTVKSRNASVVSEGGKPSKAFMVFS